jgi:hypothetical protein
LPLLEFERCAYIGAHYGKLSCLVGAEYWDADSGENRMLQNLDEGGPIKNPYELTLAALGKLPYLVKQIVMYNTYSYPALYRMKQENRERLLFLADVHARLSCVQLCSEEELGMLFDGHAAFIA